MESGHSASALDQVFACRVPFVVGQRAEVVVNVDWTEFEDADQAMVVRGMQTSHGRSTPLVWQTVTRSALKDQRNAHEDALLLRLAAVVPTGVRVTVVVCVQDRDMPDAWCLASSRRALTGNALKQMYGKRFSVEETLRDVKNPRLGLGLKQTVVTRNDRHDALLRRPSRARRSARSPAPRRARSPT